MSLPDAPLLDLSDIRFTDLALIAEMKPTAKEDPFLQGGKTRAKAIVQISRNARNLLLVANGFPALFVVGIYGDVVRLIRFDHSGAIVAPPFSIKKIANPGRSVGKARYPKLAPRPELLQQLFLWYFTHPIWGDTVVGCDPSTSRKLTPDDRTWVAEQLAKAHVENVKQQLTEFHKGRMVEVPSLVPGDPPRHYIAYRPLDVNGRLFSRATNVWRTLIEDTRILNADGQLVDNPLARTPKPQILKEAWRQLDQNSETSFYEKLAATAMEEERVGLPQPRIVCGGDLGVEEVREWARAFPLNVSSIDGHRELWLAACEGAPSPTASQFSYQESLMDPEPFPLPYPQHQTFILAIGNDNLEPTYCERSHMRFVIEDAGRPLTKCKCTKDMVAAMRDAIRGHKLAFEKGGIIHGDVSVGDVLIVDEESERHCGFLHDFDYSSMSEVAPEHSFPLPRDPEDILVCGMENKLVNEAKTKDDERKERTGTYFFMAFEILRKPGVIHTVHHDLESLYWVFIYVVLGHTNHAIPIHEARGLFVHEDDM